MWTTVWRVQGVCDVTGMAVVALILMGGGIYAIVGRKPLTRIRSNLGLVHDQKAGELGLLVMGTVLVFLSLVMLVMALIS